MWKVPVVNDWNATRSPVGDQCGRDGSRKSPVIFRAVPPPIGSDHSAFCRSMITVRPSGETVGAMLVPSWNTIELVKHELPLGTAATPPKRMAVTTTLRVRRDR